MTHTLFRHIGRLLREDEAMAVTEYAVMLSLIVIAAMGAISGLGEKMVSIFRYEYVKLDAVSP